MHAHTNAGTHAQAHIIVRTLTVMHPRAHVRADASCKTHLCHSLACTNTHHSLDSLYAKSDNWQVVSSRAFMGSTAQVWMKLLKVFTVFRTFGILLIALEKMLADFFRCGVPTS